MKKKCIIAVTLLCLAGTIQAQEEMPFTITGDVSQVKGEKIGKVYLLYFLGRERVDDSCIVKNGKYSFKGKLKTQTFATIAFGHKPGQNWTDVEFIYKPSHQRVILMSPGKIDITSGTDFVDMVVTGPKATEEWYKVQQLEKPFTDKTNQLNANYYAIVKNYPYRDKPTAQWTAKDSADEEELNSKNKDFNYKNQADGNEVEKGIYNVRLNYINNNPASPVNPRLLLEMCLKWCFNVDELLVVYNKMPEALKATPDAVRAKKFIDENWNTRVGQTGPAFSYPDTTGKVHQLNDYRGKYVVLDFWKSSCIPCRREMPHTIKLYEKYKGKGFTLLAISFDAERKAWIKAIEHDKMFGPVHLSDLKNWNNAIGLAYNVTHTPTTYLLDPDGKIIGINLQGKYLQEKLEEIYGK